MPRDAKPVNRKQPKFMALHDTVQFRRGQVWQYG